MYARLKGIDCDDDDLDLTVADRADVSIMDNRLHEHRQLTLYYTTYDLRRKKETISPTTSTSDVTVLSRDADESSKEQHPLWYGRVIWMFHVDARLRSKPDSAMERIDILWVRWFGRDADSVAGDETCQLERVRFVSKDDDSPLFSFVDPDLVLRAIHLLPAFRFGRTEDLLPPSSLARVKQASDNRGDNRSDWESFYVNKLKSPFITLAKVSDKCPRFADRDLFMHHRGGGIGHTTGHCAQKRNRVSIDLLYEKFGFGRPAQSYEDNATDEKIPDDISADDVDSDEEEQEEDMVAGDEAFDQDVTGELE